MAFSPTIQVHFNPDDIGHRHTAIYSTLDISGGGNGRLSLFFRSPAEVDQVIAELVALRADMTGDKPAPAPRCAQCGEDIESHPDPYDGDVTRWRHKSDRPSVAAFLDAEHGAGPVPMCRACENEPATEGGFCEACAPAVLLATGSLDATAATA